MFMHRSRNLIAPHLVRSRSEEVVNRNERRVLDWVRRNPGETRARIGPELDLSAQSVSRITETLRARGFLDFGERIIAGRGQPSVALTLNAAAAYSLGVSLMTDALGMVLMDLRGRTVFQYEVMLKDISRAAVLDLCERLFTQGCAEAAVDREHVFGMGIAFSGFFVGQGRLMNPLPQLEDFALIDLEQLFADRFGIPVWVDNDGNCAAMGESLIGVGNWAKSFAYLYFTSGFGGGLVIDGVPVRGAFGNAGEFGAILRPEQFEERPTLELLRRLIAEEGGPQFDSLSAMLADFDCGWSGVDSWLHVVQPHLSSVVSAICAVVDPDVIVFGGALPVELGHRLILDITIYNITRRGLRRPEPKLVVSEPDGDATAIGAASLPLKDIFFI